MRQPGVRTESSNHAVVFNGETGVLQRRLFNAIDKIRDPILAKDLTQGFKARHEARICFMTQQQCFGRARPGYGATARRFVEVLLKRDFFGKFKLRRPRDRLLRGRYTL